LYRLQMARLVPGSSGVFRGSLERVRHRSDLSQRAARIEAGKSLADKVAELDEDQKLLLEAISTISYATRQTLDCGCAVQEVRGKGQQGSRIGDARRSDRRRLRNGEEGHLGTLESAPSGLRTCWRPHRHRDDRSRSRNSRSRTTSALVWQGLLEEDERQRSDPAAERQDSTRRNPLV